MIRWVRSLLLCILFGFAGIGNSFANLGDRVPQLSDLRVVFGSLDASPDGKLIAASDGERVAIISFPSGKEIADLGPGYLPQWSPSGEAVAFYSLRSGMPQLWLWERGHEPRQLTNFEEGADPDITLRFSDSPFDTLSFSWSPSGDKIALNTRVPISRSFADDGVPLVLDNSSAAELATSGLCRLPAGCANTLRLVGTNLIDVAVDFKHPLVSQIVIIDLRSRQLTVIVDKERSSYGPVWGGRGQLYAFSIPAANVYGDTLKAIRANPTETRVSLVEIDPSSGVRRLISNHIGYARDLHWLEEDRLLFRSSSTLYGEADIRSINPNKPGTPTIAFGAAATQRLDASPNGAITVSSVSPQGISLFRARQVDRLKIARAERFADEPLLSWAWLKQGGLAWVGSDGALKFQANQQTKPRPIYSFWRSDTLTFGRSEKVVWNNGEGEALGGWVLYPPNFSPGRRYPMIVDVYPFGTPNGWMNPMAANQAWAAAGYIVFKPGLRGPHAWMNSDNRAFAEGGMGLKGWSVALDDLESGIDHLATLGAVDTNRMCIYGHSNGGAEAAYLITLTDKFKCAVIVAPGLVNWLSGTAVIGARANIKELSGGLDFDDDAGELAKMSSVFNMRKAKTPILLAVGDNDSYLNSAIQLYVAARENSVPITFVRYPGEGHSFQGSALRDFWSREMRFFEQHIGSGRDQAAE
jgi:dipeptidyl aminopeptidase/acylaminoacyl peptidase